METIEIKTLQSCRYPEREWSHARVVVRYAAEICVVLSFGADCWGWQHNLSWHGRSKGADPNAWGEALICVSNVESIFFCLIDLFRVRHNALLFSPIDSIQGILWPQGRPPGYPSMCHVRPAWSQLSPPIHRRTLMREFSSGISESPSHNGLLSFT